MNDRPRRKFVFGLDIGQENDSSALAVDERLGSPPAQHVLGHLELFPLRTPYADVVDRVRSLVNHRTMVDAIRYVAIDATGCGRPLVEMFYDALFPGGSVPTDLVTREPLVRLVPVLWSGTGVQVTKKPMGRWVEYIVPKRELVSQMAVVLEGRRLTALLKGSPHVRSWVEQMRVFRRKMPKATTVESYEAAKATDHDDLVAASMLAIWVAENIMPKEYDMSYGKATPRPRLAFRC